MAGMGLLTEFQYCINLRDKDNEKHVRDYKIKTGDFFEYPRKDYIMRCKVEGKLVMFIKVLVHDVDDIEEQYELARCYVKDKLL